MCRVVLLCPPPPAAALVVRPVTAAWSGFVLCSGVRCRVVVLRRLSCVVLLSASFCAVSCSVFSVALAGVVACCFCLFFAWPGCPLLSFGGVFCCWCPCLAAWPAALLCAVVCGVVLLRCAVSRSAVFPRGAVLWCPAVSFALLVVFVCPLPCSGKRCRAALLCCLRCVLCTSPCFVLQRVSCGPFLCCAAAPALLPCAVHCCFSCVGWCPVVLPVVSGCSSPGLVVRCLASLVVPCCVLRCVVLPCCRVLCPLVLCCLVVLSCWALVVLGGTLSSVWPCWWCILFLFPLKLGKTCKNCFPFFKIHTRQGHQHISLLRVTRQPP